MLFSNLNHDNYLTHKKGLLSWIYTTDHKRIGLLYLFTVILFFFIGGFFALTVRIILWNSFTSDSMLMAKFYNRLFTAHGLVMLFIVFIPGISSTLGNFFLPIQIGAKDFAFPRINLYSYYFYLVGIIISVYCVFFGSIDTGWTLYAPYSITSGANIYLLSIAVLMFGTSSIMTSINFLVSTMTMRISNLGWFNIPVFTWSLFASSVIQIIATPILGITILLLVFEKFFSIGIFDPKLGGDPILFQHLFWFYSHPVVYIMIIPAMGIITEIISAFSNKSIFSYKILVLSSLVIACFGFLIWGHHMFVSGQSEISSILFSSLTTLVAIPTSVKIYNWIATLATGKVDMKAPLVLSVLMIILFIIGGFTGLLLNSISLNIHFHDTYFVVAHFHFILAGSILFSFLSGLHYYWPKMFGVFYNNNKAIIYSFISFFGFLVTFFVQFFLGLQGMPRRYFHYLIQYQDLNRISTIGSLIAGLGFFLLFYNLLISLKNNSIDNKTKNPWNARTLEWTDTYSPPVEHNFLDNLVYKADEYIDCYKKDINK